MLRYLRGSFVALATVGLILPQVAQAESMNAEATNSQPAVIADVSLQTGGVLQGQVFDAQGIAQSDLEVVIERRGERIASTATNENGEFAVANLRGGTYTVRAGDQVMMCRVWAANTAPPSAKPGLLVVTGDAARGQFGLIRNYGPGVLIILGGAAAVIAISASNDDGDGS